MDNEHLLVFLFLSRVMCKWLGKQYRYVFFLMTTVGKSHKTLAKKSSRNNNNSQNCISIPEMSCPAVLQSLDNYSHTFFQQA